MIPELTKVIDQIKSYNYYKFKKDNELALLFIDAMQKGILVCKKGSKSQTGRTTYGPGGTGASDRSILKAILLSRRALEHINKPLYALTVEDAITFRDDLQRDAFKGEKMKAVYERKGNRVKRSLQPYSATFSHETKRQMLLYLRQFWRFYMDYSYIMEGVDKLDIFQRLSIKKPKEARHTIDWINSEQINSLFEKIKEDWFKLFVAISIDTGARPIEAANLRREHFFYEDGKWWSHLPEIKGCSGRKHKVEVLFQKEFIVNHIKNLQSDAFIFDFINTCRPMQGSPGAYEWDKSKYEALRLKVKYWFTKVTGKPGTIYTLRRSSSMYWLQLSQNNVLWVQRRLGHVEGSEAIKHYMQLQSIVTPDGINDAVKIDKYKSVAEEMAARDQRELALQLQLQQMQKQMELMQKAQEKLIEDTDGTKALIKLIDDNPQLIINVLRARSTRT